MIAVASSGEIENQLAITKCLIENGATITREQFRKINCQENESIRYLDSVLRERERKLETDKKNQSLHFKYDADKLDAKNIEVTHKSNALK